jgi:hypothetical protein
LLVQVSQSLLVCPNLHVDVDDLPHETIEPI